MRGSLVLPIAFSAACLLGALGLVRLVTKLGRDAEHLARRIRSSTIDLSRRGDALRAEVQITQDRLARLTRARRRS